MAGASELGEVHSYPLATGQTFDDRGYVLEAAQGGTEEVQKAASGSGLPRVGVNYKSTEDQDGNVVEPDSGEIGVVREGVFPLRADAETYELGQDVYVSSTNNGHVNGTDTTNTRVGQTTEYSDLSAESDGEDLLVKFDFS